MRQFLFSLSFLVLLTAAAKAYPPAPAHRIFGMVRTDQGAPLIALQGIVILSRGSQEVARGFTDPTLGAGINYELNVPMDAGLFGNLYQPDSIVAGTTFAIRVVISGVAFVPIEMTGTTHAIGQPGDSTRMNLSLGIDSDGDGIADAWEQTLIASDTTRRLQTLADVGPDGDLDGDGLTNLQEFLLGTSPNNAGDGIRLEVIEVIANQAHVRFVTIRGRTYGIKASTDFQNWNRVAYSLEPNGRTGMEHLASDTKVTHAYIPLNGATSMNLKLYVE